MRKQAKDLVPGDRIAFSSLEKMTNDGRHQPLVAECIRFVTVFPHTKVMIDTTAGPLFPVLWEKEFEVVEGEFEPTATQMAYTVPPAEVFEGKSLE